MKDRFGQRLMLWRIAAVLPHLRGRVLDLGCGTNDLLKHYRAKRSGDPAAAASMGLDVFDWPGADLLITDSAQLPYPDESFDTISIVAALNHIPNRLAALQECRRLIKPTGRIILTMIPPRISRVWHTVRRPWDADQTLRGMQPGEVYGLSRRQTDKLLMKAGFAPARHARFMAGFNVLTIAEPAPIAQPADVPTDVPARNASAAGVPAERPARRPARVNAKPELVEGVASGVSVQTDSAVRA